MNRALLFGSSIAAVLVCTVPINAQQQPDRSGQGDRESVQQKAPAPAQSDRAQKPEPTNKAAPGTAQSGPKERPANADKAQSAPPADKGAKGTAQGEPKDRPAKGTAQQPAPKDQPAKGTAQQPAPKDQPVRGTAGKGEPQDKATKGTAERAPQPTGQGGSAGRVQLSEQQRTNVHQTIRKEAKANRVTNVNFSINVGTRVPRSIRLAALPAGVVGIVPAYRSYRYFIVNDQVCIVEPTTYEIVEVIAVSSETAGAPARTLVLTDEERRIILSEVDINRGSTLALGALTEGSEVPSGVEVRVFTDAVVKKVPKVSGYKFFTAEDKIAIVDGQGAKVTLVIDAHR
jgi:hypothetical protein